jgi:hypothetical protein
LLVLPTLQKAVILERRHVQARAQEIGNMQKYVFQSGDVALTGTPPERLVFFLEPLLPSINYF